MPVVQGPPATQLPPEVEQAPKRGRGRPRGSRTRESAPSRSVASLETRIGGMLVVCNMMVMAIPPLRGDMLDPVEISALAKAIDAQARQSPRFRKYVEAALTAGSGGQLMGVCLIIGARRASRHGMLPIEADQQLGMLLANQAPKAGAPPAMESQQHDGANGTG